MRLNKKITYTHKREGLFPIGLIAAARSFQWAAPYLCKIVAEFRLPLFERRNTSLGTG